MGVPTESGFDIEQFNKLAAQFDLETLKERDLSLARPAAKRRADRLKKYFDIDAIIIDEYTLRLKL